MQGIFYVNIIRSELTRARINILNDEPMQVAQNFRRKNETLIFRRIDHLFDGAKLQKAVPRFEGGLLLAIIK